MYQWINGKRIRLYVFVYPCGLGRNVQRKPKSDLPLVWRVDLGPSFTYTGVYESRLYSTRPNNLNVDFRDKAVWFFSRYKPCRRTGLRAKPRNLLRALPIARYLHKCRCFVAGRFAECSRLTRNEKLIERKIQNYIWFAVSAARLLRGRFDRLWFIHVRYTPERILVSENLANVFCR